MPLPSMPTTPSQALDYSALVRKYNDFSFPQAEVMLNQAPVVAKNGSPIGVSDLRVELSSGLEASLASFRLYHVFDSKSGKFRFEDLKTQLFMGSSVEIKLGYVDALETVFIGFITGIAFGYAPEDLPYLEVTAMDIKSIMMGGTYSYQLTAKSYSEAVSEIFQKTGYEKLKSLGGITELKIASTPDQKPEGGENGKASAKTIEMVAESDYEFVVKAAKKFNFEFFVDRGIVYFRKAKSDTSTLAKIGVGRGIFSFHVSYQLTGLVGKIEARALNAGEGKLLSASKNFSNTISTSSKASSLVGQAGKVYVDPSISSKEEAESRVASLMEQMSYRLGSLEADCVGIPDLVPGRFIDVDGMGAPADNTFYLTQVTHEFLSDGGFQTKLVGCAAEMKT